MNELSVFAISGSLRRGSTNSALLRAAQRVAPSPLRFEQASIELPLYNADLSDSSQLAEVETFKQKVAAADAVLIATPEYNYGVPGPLKNALDWASRPAYKSVFYQKPVGILGASGSMVGSARAQGQLKQVLLGMASQVFPYPEFLLAKVTEKLDENGELSDATSLELLGRYLQQFSEWVVRVRPR